MKTHRPSLLPALGLCLLCASAAGVHAQQAELAMQATEAVPFMNGGVSVEEATLMRKSAKDYNLRMEFSERKDNEFVAAVDVSVIDLQGRTVLSLTDAGPIVNVKLPDGRYRVAATFHGQTETQRVTLHGNAAQDLYFHWKGQAKLDPYDGKPMGGREIPG